jgi:hypothetical protein
MASIDAVMCDLKGYNTLISSWSIDRNRTYREELERAQDAVLCTVVIDGVVT